MKAHLRLAAVTASVCGLLVGAGAASAQGQQQPDIHSILHIRPDQEAAWRAYQTGVMPPAGVIATLRASAQKAVSMNTPQRLDLQAENQALEMNIFHHQADAVRKFYAALTPQQQRTYDQIFAPHPNSQPQTH